MNYKTHWPQYILNLGIRTQPDSRCTGTNILYITHCPQYVLNLGIRTQPDSRCNSTNILYRSLLDRKGEGRGSASFVRVEPSLHRRTVSIDHISKCCLTIVERCYRPAGRGRCWQVQCREPKTIQQKVQLSSKTNHFAHLGMIYLWE